MTRPSILVVDDDRAVRESLERALDLHGFQPVTAPDGLTAIRYVQRSEPDAIVLDVSMPGVDGFGVTRRLRDDGVTTPILLLTARDDVPDRVTGLDAGADDYLVKPFALEELVARLRALLRRSATDGERPARRRIGDLTVDRDRREADRGGRRLDLTPTEFELLLAFVDDAGRVLSRRALEERVWHGDAGSSNTVEVYVGYLRRKLEAEGEPRLIRTVRGFGYVLDRVEP